MEYTFQNHVIEWTFHTRQKHPDPFNNIKFAAAFTDPLGKQTIVPAFWCGENTWHIRYASPVTGKHYFETFCSDIDDPGLSGVTGEVEVVPYDGDNPLYRHGQPRVLLAQKRFQHADGTPFFWLADTWWMGLCKQLSWPTGFQALAADRINKGFTVILLVAGLYPDMPPFDERGANEAGFPWTENFEEINTTYFDWVDQRIAWLVDAGLVPCIVGSWGYYLRFMGVDKLKQHWRYLIARYGAYPVFWCLAGEATMPYYTSTDIEREARLQKRGWTEIADYVWAVEPFFNPITIHPRVYRDRFGRDELDDSARIDFEMLQPGHQGLASAAWAVQSLQLSLKRQPQMPVLIGEACYEGVLGSNREEVQRFLFWSSLLNGAAGYTYGADGIWQVNTHQMSFGKSPHRFAIGNTPWEEAYQLPGSTHLGVGKRILTNYPWHLFDPHPEWILGAMSNQGEEFLPPAAGISGLVRVIYFHMVFFKDIFNMFRVAGLERDVRYQAKFINPSTGEEHKIGEATPDQVGAWQVPNPPSLRDWVLILEA